MLYHDIDKPARADYNKIIESRRSMMQMLKPASLFTDGAVLCRRKEIRIFGEADDGAAVTVSLYDRRGALLAEGCGQGKEGRFLTFLKPQEAQTGCRLVIEAGEERTEAEDVAIGEVFLAGGQSNMEMALYSADEGPEIIRTYEDPLLRFFNVPRMAVKNPEQRKAVDGTRWQAIAPGKGAENSAAGYFFAAALRKKMPDIPVGIIGCNWGGTSVTCWIGEEALQTDAEGQRYLTEYAERTAGKSMETYLKEEKAFLDVFIPWCNQVDAYKAEHPGAPWKEIEEACGPSPWNPPTGPGSPYRPCGLAESMLAELVPAALTGILYYQGEEDAGRTDHYDTLMILLIRHWRELFRAPELPFLFVQLPMWIDFNAEDSFRWPLTRLAQAAARDAMRNTGMVCLLDQGEFGNIHPTAKRPVGERLAELAGSMLYGGGEVSPRALEKYTEGNRLMIRLSAPVQTRDGGKPALLEIAEEAGGYVPAKAEIRDNILILSAEGVSNPVRARYAWTDYSDQVNLFGENGLPLEPFAF